MTEQQLNKLRMKFVRVMDIMINQKDVRFFNYYYKEMERTFASIIDLEESEIEHQKKK